MLTDQKIRSEDEFREHFLNNYSHDSRYGIEAHYNHYGDRGVVDAVEYQEKSSAVVRVGQYKKAKRVYEFKYTLGDPKDVTKQFNRHKKFFLKGSEFRGKPSFYFVVYPSSRNWNKLQKFESSYPSNPHFYFPELGQWANHNAIKRAMEEGVSPNWFDNFAHMFDKLGISKDELELKETQDKVDNKSDSSIDKEVVKDLVRQGCVVAKEAAETLTKEDVDKIKSLDTTPMYVSEAMLENLRDLQEVTP